MATQHNSLLEQPPSVDRVLIEKRMADILHSVPFRTSRQCQDLFRYIVEHSLSGSDDLLRERVIGIEVFARVPDYDTAEDPVVRIRAADVRKRLAQYYQAQKGESGEWKIDIPTGSYKAQFHPPDAPISQSAAVVPVLVPKMEAAPSGCDSSPVSSGHPGQRRLVWAFSLLAGCLALAFVGLMLARSSSQPTGPFDLFWAPILENARPVLVCTGSNRVYILSLQARNRYRKSHPHPQDGTPNMELLVPKEDLKNFVAEDFLPMKDTYLTIGDAAVTAQISSLLTSRRHAYDLRFGSDLSFGDLREGSAVLIGAFNNSWTLNMTDNLRFVFEAGDTAEMHVQDKSDPTRSWWPKTSDGKFVEDYAIVSRTLDSKTGRVLVTIAGLDHSGTRAAGDFVTNPQRIADLVRQAPAEWSRKNLQVVLHTTVVNNIPGSATVVAAYYW